MPSAVEFECGSDGCHLPWIKLRDAWRVVTTDAAAPAIRRKLATNQRSRRFEWSLVPVR
jgi:hypothetical protein